MDELKEELKQKLQIDESKKDELIKASMEIVKARGQEEEITKEEIIDEFPNSYWWLYEKEWAPEMIES